MLEIGAKQVGFYDAEDKKGDWPCYRPCRKAAVDSDGGVSCVFCLVCIGSLDTIGKPYRLQMAADARVVLVGKADDWGNRWMDSQTFAGGWRNLCCWCAVCDAVRYAG
jgi:hypothetical protein